MTEVQQRPPQGPSMSAHMADLSISQGTVHQKESSRPSGGSPQKQSTPLNIPARQSSLEAARHAVDPSNSPGSGPVYRGRLSRRKSSFDSNSNNLEGSPSEAGSYQGRYSGMNSIGDIQEMLNPMRVYHGKFGDTTGSSPPGPEYVAPEPRSCSRRANVIQRTHPERLDPFGPDQEYHGPLD